MLDGIGPHDISYSTTGNQAITLTITEGDCVDSITYNVAVTAVSIVSITPDTSIQVGESVTLEVVAESATGAAITIVWETLEGETPSVSPEQTTTYTVTATDEWGCSTTASVTITVIEIPVVLENILTIPNAFSPNNDGENDVFRPQGINVATYEMFIYDRWGNVLFSINTNTLSEGWDGTAKGLDVEIGVYVFYVNATFTDGTSTFLKGNVTLIR